MARRVFGCQGVVSKQGISSLANVVVHDPFGGESLHNHHKLATTEALEDTHKNFQVFSKGFIQQQPRSISILT